MAGPDNDNDRSGNHTFVVVPIDPSLRDVPCVFCLTQGKHRSKRTHPQLDFWGNEQYTICTEHVEAAMFDINNKDRLTLQQWLDSMRLVFLQQMKAD